MGMGQALSVLLLESQAWRLSEKCDVLVQLVCGKYALIRSRLVLIASGTPSISSLESLSHAHMTRYPNLQGTVHDLLGPRCNSVVRVCVLTSSDFATLWHEWHVSVTSNACERELGICEVFDPTLCRSMPCHFGARLARGLVHVTCDPFCKKTG